MPEEFQGARAEFGDQWNASTQAIECMSFAGESELSISFPFKRDTLRLGYKEACQLRDFLNAALADHPVKVEPNLGRRSGYCGLDE